MKTYNVPSRFLDDHFDRCPCDDPENQMVQEVKRVGSRVTITGTDEQIETLRSDAEFYCNEYGPDMCPPGLKRSAKATLKSLTKTES